jgi:nucleoside-diphosphate-sugar epimerase
MHRRVPDISKINKIIGWKPNINLETTVKDIYESFN